MNTTTCFAPAHILLPAEQIPLEQWGCIACDQFTSDREYWQRAKEAADGSPSTLNLILPEVYLEDGDADARVEQIHATMADYAQNVLTRAVDGGFARAMWCGDRACEDKIKELTAASSRNMPFDQTPIGDTCVCCGKKADKLIYFARAY